MQCHNIFFKPYCSLCLLYIHISLGWNWIQGKKCPGGLLTTLFAGNKGYDLETTKYKCAMGCDARDDCLYADIFIISNYQVCYLRGENCGDWQNHYYSELYHLYIKGIIIFGSKNFHFFKTFCRLLLIPPIAIYPLIQPLECKEIVGKVINVTIATMTLLEASMA